MTGYTERLSLARRFHTALITRDWASLRALLRDDAFWELPGDNAISGRIEGAEAVVRHLQQVAGYGVRFDLQHLLVSRNHMALLLHNTAERDGVRLDEHLATVCSLREGQIASIETFLSDVEGMNAFFVAHPGMEQGSRRRGDNPAQP